MLPEPRPDGHMHDDKVFFVSRIPKNKSESHLQKIFERHLPGCLLSINEPKKRSKSNFVTATVTIPAQVVETRVDLQEALKNPNGTEISLLPLFKLFFRPDKRITEKKTEEITKLKCEIQGLRKEIEALKQFHESEIAMVRIDHQDSITQVHELINQLGNHVLSLKPDNHGKPDVIKLFSPPRKRHPKSSPPHKR